VIPALHSVSYGGVWPGHSRLGLTDFLRKAAELGYPGVELAAKRPHLSPLDYDEARLAEVKGLCDELGLRIVCLASYHDFSAGGDHPDMAHQQKEVLYLRAVLEMAAALGAPVVRTYTGYHHDKPDYWQQWRWISDSIAEAAATAEAVGVKLGVQNHSTIACHHQALLALLDEIGSDAVGLVLDAPTLHMQGEDPASVVRACAGKVLHSHVSDFRALRYFEYDPAWVRYTEGEAVDLAVPAGQGYINYRAFLAALKAAGYDGALSYEMCSPLLGGGSMENLDRCARETLRFLVETWEAA